MAATTPNAPQGQESIPFWRDGRILGVIAQIVFIAITIVVGAWFVNNIGQNIASLGESQFICRDGTASFRCAFDFLSSQAQFDIAETTFVDYEPSDTYWDALYVALLNTLKVTILGIILATLLGTLVGIARLSNNWLIANLSKFYVDVFRNTPLVLQLIFIYFSVILALPVITEAIQVLNLPIYISQRGVNMPWPTAMLSFGTWAAFIILAIIQAQVLWVILGRQEERTGQTTNRALWITLSVLVVVGIGWVVATNYTNQAIMVRSADRIREFSDFDTLVLNRLDVNILADIDRDIALGNVTQDEVDAAAVTICVVRDSASEVNLTSQLRANNVPYTVDRFTRQDQATEAYAAGECEVYAAPTAVLAAERNVLEEPAANQLVAVQETPMRMAIPIFEGFNFVGGAKMTAEFTAVLVGLVLNTGASIAEIVRAGIQSVGKGQSEAARALGLSESQRLRLVILPQALRVIIPPQTSQYLNLAKNSTLALAVAFPDFWNIANTTINQSGRAIQIMLLVMVTYLILSLIISFALNNYNKRISLVER